MRGIPPPPPPRREGRQSGDPLGAPVTHHTSSTQASLRSRRTQTLTDVVERIRKSFLLEPKCATGPMLAKLRE